MKTERRNSEEDDLELFLMRETLAKLEDHNQRTYQDLESLDAKARATIGAATLFLSFGATFQLVAVSGTLPTLYIGLLIAGLVMYGLMIFLSITVVLPVEYFWPVAADWNEVTFYWTFETEKDYIKQITSDYIEAIEMNRKAVDGKARSFRISGVLFGLIIADLIIMSVVKLAG